MHGGYGRPLLDIEAAAARAYYAEGKTVQQRQNVSGLEDVVIAALPQRWVEWRAADHQYVSLRQKKCGNGC